MRRRDGLLAVADFVCTACLSCLRACLSCLLVCLSGCLPAALLASLFPPLTAHHTPNTRNTQKQTCPSKTNTKAALFLLAARLPAPLYRARHSPCPPGDIRVCLLLLFFFFYLVWRVFFLGCLCVWVYECEKRAVNVCVCVYCCVCVCVYVCERV